jgi:hypothetical protein
VRWYRVCIDLAGRLRRAELALGRRGFSPQLGGREARKEKGEVGEERRIGEGREEGERKSLRAGGVR